MEIVPVHTGKSSREPVRSSNTRSNKEDAGKVCGESVSSVCLSYSVWAQHSPAALCFKYCQSACQIMQHTIFANINASLYFNFSGGQQ
jgi:hypothetical protein